MLYTTAKNLLRIRILLLTGTVLIVVIVLIDAFSTNSQQLGSVGKYGSKASGTTQGKLIEADELLHARLWQLQNMDHRYASLVSTQNDVEHLAKSNLAIQFAEESFRKSIDSIDRVGKQYDQETGTNDFQNMTTFFKTILENRRFLSNARLGLASEEKGPAVYRQIILNLQDEITKKDKLISGTANNSQDDKSQLAVQTAVAEKDKQIASLESQLQKEGADKKTYADEVQKLQTELTEKNKIIASSANKNVPTDQKALVNLQTQVTEKNKRIGTLEDQVRKEQSDKDAYIKAVQKIQGDMVEKDKMISALSNIKIPVAPKATVTPETGNTQRNAQQIQDLQAQIQKEKSEKKTISESIEKYKKDLVEKDKMISALSNIKIPEAKKESVKPESGLTQKDNQLRDLQTQIQKEQSEKKAISEALEKNKRELVEKDKMIATLSNIKVPTAQKTQPSLQNDLNEKNKRIRTLEVQLQNNQSEKQTYTQTINNLQLELIEKNKIIASAGNRKLPTDQKALVTLQNEIAEKDKRIRSLEAQVRNGVSSRPAAGESVKDLEQRNANLRLAYNNTMTQLGVLQKKYNLIKAEVDELKNQ